MIIKFLNEETLHKKELDTLCYGDIFFLKIKEIIHLGIISDKKALFQENKVNLPVVYSFNSQMHYPNTVLFSMNSIDGRYGNSSILDDIFNEIGNEPIRQLIQNLISILKFKVDRIDSDRIGYLLQLPHEMISCEIKKEGDFQEDGVYHLSRIKKSIDTITKRIGTVEDADNTLKSNKNLDHPSTYYFFDYLNDKDSIYWLDNYKTTDKLHNIYKALKKRDPLSFKNSFCRFREDHPLLNIHSQKDKPVSNSKSESHAFERNEDLCFVYDALEKHGLKQISDSKWKNKEGTIFIVSIEKET